MCEAQEVRYVHTMEHPGCAEELRVGCICAGHMEEDLVGARKREDAFKASRSRRARWLTREWRTSRACNEYLNTDGFNVVVYPIGAAWGARYSIARPNGVECWNGFAPPGNTPSLPPSTP
jgi:hypothetical protein